MKRFGGWAVIGLFLCLIHADDAVVQETHEVSQDEIRGWIRALGDAKFSVRETASKRLTQFGQKARKALQQTVKDPQVGLETRRRAQSILDSLARSVSRELTLEVVPKQNVFDSNEPLVFEFRIRNVTAQPIRVFNLALAGAYFNQIEFAKSGRFTLIDSKWISRDWKLRCIAKKKRDQVKPVWPVTIKPGQEYRQTFACDAPLFFRDNATHGHIGRGDYLFDVELRLFSGSQNDNECHLGVIKARSKKFHIGDSIAEAKRNKQRRRSKPVRVGDVQFELLAPEVWPDVARGHQYHFDLGLHITNHGKHDLWFVQNEMKLSFVGANAKPVPGGLNRDSLRVYPPICIGAGGHLDIAFPAILRKWENGVKAVRIADKTGGYWCFEPLEQGNTSVSLQYKNKIRTIDAKWAESLRKRFGLKIPSDALLWTGEFTTEPLEIQIVGPKKE